MVGNRSYTCNTNTATAQPSHRVRWIAAVQGCRAVGLKVHVEGAELVAVGRDKMALSDIVIGIRISWIISI